MLRNLKKKKSKTKQNKTKTTTTTTNPVNYAWYDINVRNAIGQCFRDWQRTLKYTAFDSFISLCFCQEKKTIQREKLAVKGKRKRSS